MTSDSTLVSQPSYPLRGIVDSYVQTVIS